MIDFEITKANGDPAFVRVLDMFVHHYTKETMRRIRIESIVPNGASGTAEYCIMNETEFEDLLGRRNA